MSYQPDPFQDDSALGRYLVRELNKLSDDLRANTVEAIEYEVHYVEPDKPRTGQMYYADGTSWTGDGSSGEGLYLYKSGGSWVFVG